MKVLSLSPQPDGLSFVYSFSFISSIFTLMENNDLKAGHFFADKNRKPLVIDKESQVNVKLNPFTIDVIKDVIEHLVNEYGIEEFMLMAKEVSTKQRPPKQGIELWITMLSAIVVMFEDQANIQGFCRELDDQEMEIYKRKMEEFDTKFSKEKLNGN